jgi:hypothetical protein
MEANTKLITFKCSASCGDIVYSLIAVKELCKRLNAKAVYYIYHNDPVYSTKRSVNTYKMLKRLLEHQSYIESCREYDGGRVDYDLDLFRKSKRSFANNPLPLRFFDAVGLAEFEGWQEPWLEKPSYSIHSPVNYLNVTERYNDYDVDFREVLPLENAYFLGTEKEHEKFVEYPRYLTDDLYQCAQFLASAKALYCNQSALLTIAQGMGVQVYLAKDRRFNSTIVGNKTTVL